MKLWMSFMNVKERQGGSTLLGEVEKGKILRTLTQDSWSRSGSVHHVASYLHMWRAMRADVHRAHCFYVLWTRSQQLGPEFSLETLSGCQYGWYQVQSAGSILKITDRRCRVTLSALLPLRWGNWVCVLYCFSKFPVDSIPAAHSAHGHNPYWLPTLP